MGGRGAERVGTDIPNRTSGTTEDVGAERLPQVQAAADQGTALAQAKVQPLQIHEPRIATIDPVRFPLAPQVAQPPGLPTGLWSRSWSTGAKPALAT